MKSELLWGLLAVKEDCPKGPTLNLTKNVACYNGNKSTDNGRMHWVTCCITFTQREKHEGKWALRRDECKETEGKKQGGGGGGYRIKTGRENSRMPIREKGSLNQTWYLSPFYDLGGGGKEGAEAKGGGGTDLWCLNLKYWQCCC